MAMSTAKAWIDAFIELEKDSASKVKCPECGNGYLYIEEVDWQNETNKDVYLICDLCGKYNVATCLIKL